LESPCTTSYSS